MPDVGHELTDKKIEELEKKVAREYNQARKDVQRKLNEYMAEFAEQDKKKRALLESGKITKKDYQDWRLRKMGMGKRWEEMRDNLAQDYHNANQIARSIERGYMPDVYALNHNYATYQIEHDGGIDSFYSLYDKPTVERLIREDQILMPEPGPRRRAQIAANKDMQWNNQMLQSALTQSILQGESIPEMARRISQTVAVRNYNSSVRYARTMATSAQNAGRYDAYRRATDMGIDLTIEWCATLDDRTRHDHRMMHGQRRNVDEPFETPDGFRIYYPADCTGESDAPQQEIWNCRCTLLAWVKGFERDTVKESPGMGDMTFEEWQNEKKNDSENGADNGIINTINVSKNADSKLHLNLQLFAERALKTQKDSELISGIKSHQKNIEKHKEFIKEPTKKDPNYYSKDVRYQKGLLNHWRVEIENSEEAIQNRIDELKERGVDYGK